MTSIGTVAMMKTVIDECENQVITDGNQVWVDARDALEKAVAYQTAKQDAALKKAYS